jgi:hypothetical protein
MVILCCYAGDLKAQTKDSLAAFAPDAIILDVSRDKWAYWEAIETFYQGQNDLMIVEQDIEILEECIPSFAACPEPWCVYEYRPAQVFGFMLDQSLGCTRFRKELQQAVPASQIASATLTQWAGHAVASSPRIPWDRIDMRIAEHLKVAGFKPHVHGRVKHYHVYPDHNVNAMVQTAVDNYLMTRRFGMDELTQQMALATVKSKLGLANSGELNATM